MICPNLAARLAYRPLIVIPLLVAIGSICPGCGGEDWQAAAYPTSGTLTVNGEPAAGAVVELRSVGQQPDVRNSRPWAVVQDDGSFVLSTYETGDGAPVGEYAVTVRWPPDVTQPSLVDRLGGAYATPAGAPATVTIAEGENQLAPIEITGAKVRSKQQVKASRRSPPGPPMGGGGAS